MKEMLEELAYTAKVVRDQIRAHTDAAVKSGDLTKLVIHFRELKEGYEALDEIRKDIYKILDALDKGAVPDALDQAQLDLIRVPEIGRSFYIVPKLTASIPKEVRPQAHEWLIENGGDSLIQETVNASSLAGFVKEMIEKQGKEPPPDLIKVNTYRVTGSSKYNPAKGK